MEFQMSFFFPHPWGQIWKENQAVNLKPGEPWSLEGRGAECERLSRGWWESEEVTMCTRKTFWKLWWPSTSVGFQWRTHISSDASTTECVTKWQWKASSPILSRKLMSVPLGCQEDEWISPHDSDSELRRWAPLWHVHVLQGGQSLALPSPHVTHITCA